MRERVGGGRVRTRFEQPHALPVGLIPLHLAGDRGIFGNGFKPRALPFEGHPPAAEGHQPAEVA